MTVEERLQKIETTLEKIDASIRGNGRPGLNTRVQLLEERSKQLWKLVGAVILGAGTAGAGVSQILKAFLGS